MCFFSDTKKQQQNLAWHQAVNIVLHNCTVLFYIIHPNVLARSFLPRVSDDADDDDDDVDDDPQVLMNRSGYSSDLYVSTNVDKFGRYSQCRLGFSKSKALVHQCFARLLAQISDAFPVNLKDGPSFFEVSYPWVPKKCGLSYKNIT